MRRTSFPNVTSELIISKYKLSKDYCWRVETSKWNIFMKLFSEFSWKTTFLRAQQLSPVFRQLFPDFPVSRPAWTGFRCPAILLFRYEDRRRSRIPPNRTSWCSAPRMTHHFSTSCPAKCCRRPRTWGSAARRCPPETVAPFDNINILYLEPNLAYLSLT